MGATRQAKERLEFIIHNDSDFPGRAGRTGKGAGSADDPDADADESTDADARYAGRAKPLFATAQQLIAAGDWANALTALDQMRKEAPDFNTSQVDGMYYFALRNYGVNLIQQQGDLEGGIYQLTLAERFAPLDNTAANLREGARAYIQALSYFGVNWSRAVELFRNVAGGMARHVGWQHERQPALPDRADALRRSTLGAGAGLPGLGSVCRRRKGSGEPGCHGGQELESGLPDVPPGD